MISTSEFCAMLVESIADFEDARSAINESGVSVDFWDNGTWRIYIPLPGFVFFEIASGRAKMKDGMVVLP